jgi:hypothetical protein
MLLVAPGKASHWPQGDRQGVAGSDKARRQPLRHTAVHAGAPQVVVADKDHGVAMHEGWRK